MGPTVWWPSRGTGGSSHTEPSTTPSPTLDSDDLYWGPEFEARTTYIGCGSRSPQPSEGDLEKERRLREALQQELHREIRAKVSVCCLVPGFCLFRFQVYHLPFGFVENFHDVLLRLLRNSTHLLILVSLIRATPVRPFSGVFPRSDNR